MKKPTIREMRWTNKGFIKSNSYNRFEAKAEDSLFLCESDENFEINCKIKQSKSNQGFIISLTDSTYFSIIVKTEIVINSSIKGYKTQCSFPITPYLEKNEYIKLKVIRNCDIINYYLEFNSTFESVAKAFLPGAKVALSFGFILQDNELLSVQDFYYSKIN
ncbi:MAG: hypothetical protein JJE21_01425 [Spirochaetaceae bacterium]|nr:hypothetical protein [Spirochaetaceae bacterium]